MASRRVARLNEQLKREITELLREGVRDPRIGFVTITSVSVTPDLSFARVRVVASSEEPERANTLAGLRAAAPYLRSEIGRRLHIRRAPELRFEEDRGLEHAMRIERLLHEAAEQSGTSESAGAEGEPDGRDS